MITFKQALKEGVYREVQRKAMRFAAAAMKIHGKNPDELAELQGRLDDMDREDAKERAKKMGLKGRRQK